MSKPAIFTKADVARALGGATEARMKVRECVIDRLGAIRMIFDDGSPSSRKTPWTGC